MVSGVDERVVSGVDERVVSGVDERVVSGVDERVVSGVDERVVSGFAGESGEWSRLRRESGLRLRRRALVEIRLRRISSIIIISLQFYILDIDIPLNSARDGRALTTAPAACSGPARAKADDTYKCNRVTLKRYVRAAAV